MLIRCSKHRCARVMYLNASYERLLLEGLAFNKHRSALLLQTASSKLLVCRVLVTSSRRSAGATSKSMPERARFQERRRRAEPSISGQASTATASAPVRGTSLSTSSKLPSTGMPSAASSSDGLPLGTQAPTIRMPWWASLRIWCTRSAADRPCPTRRTSLMNSPLRRRRRGRGQGGVMGEDEGDRDGEEKKGSRGGRAREGGGTGKEAPTGGSGPPTTWSSDPKTSRRLQDKERERRRIWL